MTTQAIERPQAMVALERANDIRLKRAQLKRDIKTGSGSVAATLADVPYYALTMTLGDLLRAQWRWHRHRTSEFCRRVVINENRQLADLTERQRRIIVAELG